MATETKCERFLTLPVSPRRSASSQRLGTVADLQSSRHVCPHFSTQSVRRPDEPQSAILADSIIPDRKCAIVSLVP